MKHVIEITRDNLDQLAKGFAASLNNLGFRKNGKEMVPSQAIRILAERLGMNEHALVKSLKSSTPAAVTPSPEHNVLAARVAHLNKLGYEVHPDSDQPSLWVWRHGNEGCDMSLESPDAAYEDAWAHASQQGLTDHLGIPASVAHLVNFGYEVPDLPLENNPTEMQLTTAALEAKWGAEHAWYGRDEWREDVAQGNTTLGYWEWAQHSLEGNGGEENHCSKCGKPLNDGEGQEGRCGECADQVESFEEYKEEAESLGINFEDVKLWVQTHYKTTFEAGSHDRRMDWLHAYRQFNGLTPSDAVARSLSAEQLTRRAADDAFESYDFGEDVTVAAHNGWSWGSWAFGDTLLFKTVFLESKSQPEAPSSRVTFSVNVENGVVTDVQVSS